MVLVATATVVVAEEEVETVCANVCVTQRIDASAHNPKTLKESFFIIFNK